MKQDTSSYIITHFKAVRLRLLLAFWLSLITVGTQAVQFRRLSVADGLSNLTVLSLCQDHLGRIWIGTDEGINVFDGGSVKAFKNYGKDVRPTGYTVDDISADGEDNIWFVSDSSLVKYDQRQQRFSLVAPSGVSNVTTIGNRIYWGQNGKIFLLVKGEKNARTLCQLPHGVLSTDLYAEVDGHLWIGTERGLYLYSQQRLRLVVPDQIITACYRDSHRNLWVSTQNQGCIVIHPDGSRRLFQAPASYNSRNLYNVGFIEQSQSTSIASNNARGITEDARGHIWIGTFLGLNEYDPSTGRFTLYTHTSSPTSLGHSSVFPVLRDRRGNIWTGSYYGGVSYFSPGSDRFRYYAADINRTDCLSYPFIGHMVEDLQGRLWIATEGGGLDCLDRRTGSIKHYISSSGNSIAHNNVKCLAYDGQHSLLYIGTHLGGLSILNLSSQHFDNSFIANPEVVKRVGDRIFSLQLWKGGVYFTSVNGFWKMNPSTKAITRVLPESFPFCNTYFFIDAQGQVWLDTSQGLLLTRVENPKTYKLYSVGRKGLGHFTSSAVTADDEGRIVVATKGSGLYVYQAKADSFRAITAASSPLLSDFCYEILPYGRHRVAVNTDRGICFIDTRSCQVVAEEPIENHAIGGISQGNGMALTRDGHLFVAGTNGLLEINLNSKRVKREPDRIFFSRLYVNNREVMASDSTGILSEALYLRERIDLKNGQNNLVITFSTDDYIDESRPQEYEYFMEGLDDEWHRTDGQRVLFSQLQPGWYRLKVRRVGSPESQTAELSIVVHPPFYLSVWAYLLYFLLFIAALMLIYRSRKRQWQLQVSLQKKQQEKENAEQLNQAKLRFFTNISHELRTPLTLIIAKLKMLADDLKGSDPVKRRVNAINVDAQNMLSLVNEQLDFRKITQGHVELHPAEADVVAFARNIFADFEALAKVRGISYEFHSSAPAMICLFDSVQMEKVLRNLLSNAFKYVSKDNPHIEVFLESYDEGMRLKVMDNGKGIAAADIEHIFDRFYQSDDDQKGNYSRGFGIGLALTREIMRLHRGDIRVESAVGYGSVFTAEWPTEVKLVNAEVQSESMPSSLSEPMSEPEPAVTEAETDDSVGSYSILLVEDNEDLLQTLSTLFGRNCKVFLARNGVEGLEQVRRQMPDIVVSDIMMPEMDGLEMCRRIKNDITVCHIPVVLLTAMGTTDQTVDGLRSGADSYISKPFEPRLLLARCNNLIRQRQLLRHKFLSEDRPDLTVQATNALDRKFLENCKAYIGAHLSEKIAVENLAHQANMGRSAFFQKFKSLTGQTPADYIAAYRLSLAAEWLLQKKDKQISEIAYDLGFSTPRYFSVAFKSKYGCTPRDYQLRK